MNYRSEIDGLRAIAVLPVILYHAGFNLFGGGFIGVDIFFVISGYLITSILLEEIKNHHFSIVNFYLRRAKRILPALFFVMIICIPFAWLWMLPSEMKAFSQSLIAISFFLSNIFFLTKETDYFGGDVHENPLIHTWSLAVEEQFYIFFPFMLLFFWRFNKNKSIYFFCIFAICSLIASEWFIRNNLEILSFYMIFTRCWELFAGVIVAMIIDTRGIVKSQSKSMIGLGCILFAIIFYSKNTPIPGIYTLIPVIGTMLIILHATKETLVARLLRFKFFIGIGLISYSAYLWHQPLFAFAKIRLFDPPSLFITSLLTISSFLIGALSWKFIEQPFRRNIELKNLNLLFLIITIVLFFSIFGIAGIQKDGFAKRLNFELPSSVIKHNSCHNYKGADDCLKKSQEKKTIFFLGDSHASQTYTSLRKFKNIKPLEASNIEIKFHSFKNSEHFPYSFIEKKYKSILSDKTLNVLFKNIKKDDYLVITILSNKISKKQNKEFFIENMEKLLQNISQKKINLILQIHNPIIPKVKWLHCYNEYRKYNRSSCGISKSDYLNQIKDLNQIYKKLCENKSWCTVLPITNLYFKDSDWFEPMKKMSFVDENHLSDYELKRLGVFYLKYFDNKGLLESCGVKKSEYLTQMNDLRHIYEEFCDNKNQ